MNIIDQHGDDLLTPWTWEKLDELLGVVPSENRRYSDEQIRRIEEELGCVLPPSYLEYIQRWGPGLAFGLFVIWTPHDNPNLDIVTNYRKTKRLLADQLANGLWQYEYVSLIENLIPFGDSENGDILAWHSNIVSPDEEMCIYLLENEQNGAPCVGQSLLEFFGDYCVNGKLDDVFPVGKHVSWNLQSSFEQLT